MDDDNLLDEADFAPVEYTVERLPVLSLAETHEVLRLLVAVAQESGPLAPEADRLAKEIAARIPSQD
ncbi:DUF6417 family protein [Streptomyces sp. NPDC058256]|uniref:DUF6417 family protein n=1 Tax=Streptomyces sp. NPDC058256 TaxID=3346408 RepID=UPI0036EEE9AD